MKRWNNYLKQWLAAEQGGRVEQAEEALKQAFAALSEPIVSARFAENVLRRLGAQQVSTPVSTAARWAIAAAMVAASISVAYLPLVLLSLSGVFEIGGLVEIAGFVLVSASRMFAAWMGFWQALAEVSRVVFNIVSRPQIAIALLASVGVCALALRWVADLMSSDGSTDYA